MTLQAQLWEPTSVQGHELDKTLQMKTILATIMITANTHLVLTTSHAQFHSLFKQLYLLGNITILISYVKKIQNNKAQRDSVK